MGIADKIVGVTQNRYMQKEITSSPLKYLVKYLQQSEEFKAALKVGLQQHLLNIYAARMEMEISNINDQFAIQIQEKVNYIILSHDDE